MLLTVTNRLHEYCFHTIILGSFSYLGVLAGKVDSRQSSLQKQRCLHRFVCCILTNTLEAESKSKHGSNTSHLESVKYTRWVLRLALSADMPFTEGGVKVVNNAHVLPN